jgi:hypothetical protein
LRFPEFTTLALIATLFCFPGVGLAPGHADEPAANSKEKSEATKPEVAASANHQWTLLNGEWEISQFGGDGDIEIKENSIKMGFGDPLTGLHWTGDVHRENFEIELEAKRVDGFDFFCGLTFPVGKTHVTLVLGGWGGGVLGISSIDGHDASENDTTMFRNFDNDKWYKVRARVDEHQIQCWIDDKIQVEQEREGHEFDIRYEMDLTVPVGLAAFQCDVEYRNMRIRKLTESEIAAAKKLASKEGEESKSEGDDQK